MKTTRKFKLTILGNKEEKNIGYKFIRDSQYAQYQALNISVGYLGGLYLEYKDFNNEEYKLKKRNFKFNKANPKFEGINFGKGIDTLSLISQYVKREFSNTPLKQLARGERSLPTFKRTFPLMVTGKSLKFNYDEDGNVIIKWVNKISFKVVLGSGKINKNKIELQHTLNKIINGEYKVGQSSLDFDKNNNLIINLTFDIPNKESKELIKDRILGVDLGIKYPAFMCLNDNTYKKEGLGCADDFIRVREQMQHRRKKLQRSLKLTNGGKGRNKKLQALDRLRDKEKDFVTTYNHAISNKIVEFAKKHKCEYIHLEKLTKDGFPNTILRNWSYYQLQSYIEYKAEREGIKVRYVDPSYTSQTCSRCGNIDKENRQTQEEFKCTKCGFELNADHNAAINISRSIKIIK